MVVGLKGFPYTGGRSRFRPRRTAESNPSRGRWDVDGGTAACCPGPMETDVALKAGRWAMLLPEPGAIDEPGPRWGCPSLDEIIAHCGW